MMKGKRLPILAALVIALLMVVQSSVSYSLESRRIENLLKHEMDDAEQALQYFLIKVYDAAEEMVRLSLSSLDEPDKIFSLAERVLLKYDDLSDCYIGFVPDFFPRKGRLYAPCAYWLSDTVIVHSQFGENLDYTVRDWYTGALNGDSDGFWSTAYEDPDFKKPVITHSVKILSPDGEPIGVVGVDVEADWLKLTMEGCRPDDHISCRLFNAEGALLMEAGPKVDASSMDRYLVVESTLPHIGIRLIVSVPKNAIWEKVGWISLLTLMILLGSILILGWLMQRYLHAQKALARAETEQEVTRKEMSIAHSIQMGMLPRRQYHREDVHIQGSLVPAREVGGDIYDYFIRDEKLFFCVGDVSGKGASSAMLMGVTHALFRSASAHESNPAKIVQAINETTCLGNDANMFVTLYIGVLDLPTGRLVYCSAGHDSPFVADEGGIHVEKCKPHLPVGVFDDVKYSAQETLITPGSTVFLYTDGLTEAKNSERKQFGLQRVRETLAGCVARHMEPEQILETMGEEVRAFTGEAPQSDDLTMLVIRYTPGSKGASQDGADSIIQK